MSTCSRSAEIVTHADVVRRAERPRAHRRRATGAAQSAPARAGERRAPRAHRQREPARWRAAGASGDGGPRGRREQADHGRPRAADERRSAPASRACASASAICGHSETAARCRSLCSSSVAAGSGAPCRARRAIAPRARRAPGACAASAEPVGLRVDGRRRQLRGQRQHEHPERRSRSRSALQPLAGAARQPAPGRDLRGHVGAQLSPRACAAARSSPSPEACAARRSAAAASAEPPPRPAATGIRLTISAAAAAPVPAGARPERAQRRRGEVLRAASHARADAPRRRSAPAGAGSSVSSSASEIDCITLDELVPAVARATGPTNRPRLTFAGRERARQRAIGCQQACASSSRERRSPPGTGAPPARRRDGRAASAPRAPARASARAPPPAPARATPPASCAGARTRRHERAQRGRALPPRPPAHRRRALAPAHPHEHRVDVRAPDEDGARDRAAAPRTSHASWASTDGTP